jgi:lipopolysaccharide cholinephosphotransferase
MEFEGIEFPVPGNTDAYLTKIYGDWRKLPSEEQIRKTMHYPLYIKEIFGE